MGYLLNLQQQAYSCLWNIEKAIESYQKSLQVYPRCLQSLINLACAYSDKEMFKEAEELSNRIKEIDITMGYVSLANMYIQMDNMEKVKEYCERIFLLDPLYSPAFVLLAGIEKLNFMHALHEKQLSQTEKEEKMQNSAQSVYRVINMGIQFALDVDHLKKLQETKKSMNQLLMDNQLLLKYNVDEHPENVTWKEDRFRLQFKKKMTNYLHRANNMSQEYRYMFEQVRGTTFVDVIVIAWNKK